MIDDTKHPWRGLPESKSAADSTGPSGGSTWPILTSLVGDRELFADRYWSRCPLVFHSSAAWNEMLSGAAISTLLNCSIRRPHVRMVRNGETLPAGAYTKSVRLGGSLTSDVADVDRIGRQFGAGSTLVLQSLERLHPPLSGLASGLQAEISHRVQVNAYLSPPEASGLARHSDAHDVFVVQIEGAKSWNVDGLGAVQLAEGDVLYIPRGCSHAAATSQRHSLHLTIGVLSVTYADVVRRAVTSLGDRFDRALPLGFAAESQHADLAAAIGGAISTAAIQLRSADVTEIARSEQHRVVRDDAGTHRLLQELGLVDVTDATLIRLTPGATSIAVGDSVELRFGDRWIRVPGAAAPAIEALVASETLAVGDLTGLNAPSRLVLARRLVREGAAELVGR